MTNRRGPDERTFGDDLSTIQGVACETGLYV